MIALLVEWDGESFFPVGRSQRDADEHFVVGRRYRLVEEQQRSQSQHKFYFACVNDAWANMTDAQRERWASPEHLRRWALIKAGFCDRREIVCASKAEAIRMAAFIRPLDPYAVVVAREAVVAVYTAQSQSVKAMGKQEFSRSTDAVLHVISEILGCRPEDLGKAA